MKKNGIVFCGQGISKLNYAKELPYNNDLVRTTFEEVNGCLSYDLRNIMFNRNEEHGNQFEQISLFIYSISLYRVLNNEILNGQNLYAGLSLGEYAAITAAKILPLDEMFKIVKLRGELMNIACKDMNTTMVALVGKNNSGINHLLDSPVWRNRVYIANKNSPFQMVVGLTESDESEFLREIKKINDIVGIPLNVAGAFHTPFMAQANNEFKKALLKFEDIRTNNNVLSNFTGDLFSSNNFYNSISNQMVSTTQFGACISRMYSLGVKEFFVICPNYSLEKIVRANLPQATKVHTIKSVEDIMRLKAKS